MSRKKTAEATAPDYDADDVLGRGFEDEDEDEQELDRGDDLDGVDEDDEGEVEEEEVEEEEVEEEEVEEEEAEEEEAEEEAEPEEEEADEPKEEAAPVKKDTNPLVPRSRLNQEIQRRKALEQQIAQFSQQQQKAPEQAAAQPKQVDKAAIAKALEKVLDGDVENASDALAEVLSAMGTQAVAESSPTDIAAAVQAEIRREALQRRADEIIESNPFLDDMNEEAFDSDAAEDVIAMRDSAIRRGADPVKALEDAVAKVSKLYGYAAEEAPAPAKKADPKLKKADVAAKVKKAEAAPARIPKTTQPKNRERVALSDMSESEFDNMSRDALRRARGDIL